MNVPHFTPLFLSSLIIRIRKLLDPGGNCVCYKCTDTQRHKKADKIEQENSSGVEKLKNGDLLLIIKEFSDFNASLQKKVRILFG